MSAGLNRTQIAAAFEAACLAELDAMKPGNAHRVAGGHRLEIAQFEQSAAAAAPYIADIGLGVGARIREAVEATARAVKTNTNLGILLLCAPLAVASQSGRDSTLEHRTAAVLASLTVADAVDAYAGIRAAEAGGLGRAEEQDIAGEPSVTLLEAMRAAEDRDRIAWNYTHGLADIFGFGLAELHAAEQRLGETPWAITLLYLGFFCRLPDTLIARKFGTPAAETVRAEAATVAVALKTAADPTLVMPELLAFDARLKARRFNPGTSADLTVATVFARRLQQLESAE